jgi:hypothetical protein
MFTATKLRAKAAECTESLKHTDVPSKIRQLRRSKERFTELAQNEDWLADNFEQSVRSGDTGDGKSVAKTEEHILRCLGAAVIMHWNTIPTKLRRELFDTAGSMGDVLKSVALRGQIARFLHKQND